MRVLISVFVVSVKRQVEPERDAEFPPCIRRSVAGGSDGGHFFDSLRRLCGRRIRYFRDQSRGVRPGHLRIAHNEPVGFTDGVRESAQSGVILRVGDKASIFDSASTRFLAEVAGEMQKQGGFRFQRALMSGGTCEASAYQEFGYTCAAVCVALGNYHNCGPRDRIAAEYVSVDDAVSMVELLAAAAKRMPHFKRLAGRLPARLNKLLAEARRRFKAERSRPAGAGS
jgi:hypothetical protein